MSGRRKTADDCTEFYKKYVLARQAEIKTSEELSFLLGYYAHLITDAELQRYMRDPARVANAWKRIKEVPELAEKTVGLAEDWDTVKKLFPTEDRMKDFYCMEREYLDEHPDSGWYTEIKGLEYFPDYIDYLPKQSIPKKIQMMFYDPLGENSAYPFLGFSREEYNRFVESTIKYFPEGTHDNERHHYPVPADKRFQPSVYYVDIIEGILYDEYGIATYIDKYLDVIFTPEGDVKMEDRDELDAAYASGELTKDQYDAALREGESILREYCVDISKTDAWCAKIREMVEKRIKAGEPMKLCKEVLEFHNGKI